MTKNAFKISGFERVSFGLSRNEEINPLNHKRRECDKKMGGQVVCLFASVVFYIIF